MTIDLNKPWCTYRTSHPTGVFYEGKGKTAAVASGAYTGSGIRFKLAQSYSGYEPGTWKTNIIETFATEAEAYAAEADLVPLSELANPLRLNMVAGGDGAMRQNHSLLYKKINAAKRAKAREEKRARAKVRADKAKAKKVLQNAKMKELKKQLKDKK